MNFLKSCTFYVVVLLQFAGLLLFGLGTWANIIQYVSGFGMAYALYEYFTVHKKEIQHLKDQIHLLHEKHDELHKRHTKLLNTLEQFVNPRVR